MSGPIYEGATWPLHDAHNEHAKGCSECMARSDSLATYQKLVNDNFMIPYWALGWTVGITFALIVGIAIGLAF